MVSETQVIWKFPVAGFDNMIAMPRDATLLSAQMQGEQICLWALVDPAAERVERRIVVGTGERINRAAFGGWLAYVATVQAGPLVWHVFEVIE